MSPGAPRERDGSCGCMEGLWVSAGGGPLELLLLAGPAVKAHLMPDDRGMGLWPSLLRVLH